MYQLTYKRPLLAVLVGLNSLLMGCTATLPVKVLPPVELLQDCTESNIDIRTNGGLAKAVPILRQDIKVCNLDKQALRKWAEE